MLKHGRHPMFNEVSTADLIKAQFEAKHFGYRNPLIEATLQITNKDGTEAAVPVVIHTADGRLEDPATEEYLRSPESADKERQKGLYRVKYEGIWTIAEYRPTDNTRHFYPQGHWLSAHGNLYSEEFEDISDERIPMPDDRQELDIVPDTSGKSAVMHLQVGKKQFKVETTHNQQCRVVDLPGLQRFVARRLQNPEHDVEETCTGPS